MNFNRNIVANYLKVLRELGFDLFWYQKQNNQQLYLNEFEIILNQEEKINDPEKGCIIYSFEKFNVCTIQVDEVQDEKYLDFKQVTKIALRQPTGKTNYRYFMKLPNDWDNKLQEPFLSALSFESKARCLNYHNLTYEVINKIKLKDTAILQGELWETLKRFNKQVIDYNNNFNGNLDFFTLKNNFNPSSPYKVSYHLLHNLIPEKILEKDICYMEPEEQELIKNNNITFKGFDLDLSGKRLLETLLVMISNTSYVFNKDKLSTASFKISQKALSKLTYNKNSRIDKTLKTARTLSSRLFFYKNKCDGGEYMLPILDMIFELKEMDGELIFTFSKYFLKNLRPIKDEGYFTTRERGFYDSLDLGRGYGKDNHIYTFLDYLFLIRNQNFNAKQKPYIKSNLSNLLEKIGLKSKINSKGVTYVFKRFNHYLKMANDFGFLEFKEFKTVTEFKEQLNNSESLNITFL